jgi:glycosyltransferase involved in cell wall biosynthesis
MNRPIVAADHGGAVEVVVASETGFRTPPGDAKALAVAILKVGQLSGVATARDRIARDYSKSALQAAVLRVYETLSPDRG